MQYTPRHIAPRSILHKLPMTEARDMRGKEMTRYKRTVLTITAGALAFLLLSYTLHIPLLWRTTRTESKLDSSDENELLTFFSIVHSRQKRIDIIDGESSPEISAPEQGVRTDVNTGRRQSTATPRIQKTSDTKTASYNTVSTIETQSAASPTEDAQSHSKGEEPHGTLRRRMPSKVSRLDQRRMMSPGPVGAPSGGRCTGEICLERLSSGDMWWYKMCLDEAKKTYGVGKMRPCSCKLMDGTGRGRVALVSFPGSGNTWVRGLLERTTGVCTGSMWCDPLLRAQHFCGEGVRSPAILVVKNHAPLIQWKGEPNPKPNPAAQPVFEAVIFIHRDPFAAMIAEWNRAASFKYGSAEGWNNSHVSFYGKEMFGNNTEWEEMVGKRTKWWKDMMENYFIKRGDHPLLLVRYEDLKRDAVHEVKRMLEFLRFPYKEGEVERRLSDGYSFFYRNHTDDFDHYTPQQKQDINNVIREVVRKADDNNVTDLQGLRLEQYIRS